MTLLSVALAIVSIGLGVFGWLAPRYTLATLDLTPGETSMGPSEIRASAGALFVGMGLGVLILQTPAAIAMLGFCWAGAAIGRATSLVLDGATQKKWVFFAVEAVVAVIALAAGLVAI